MGRLRDILTEFKLTIIGTELLIRGNSGIKFALSSIGYPNRQKIDCAEKKVLKRNLGV